ncbi:hypothetical protein FHR83_002027 [Actinoplanes campanulatus]|uniref:Uncharacterized protein n=1 Tax=Actinoplanes campanulatus TaxID=113559 RepID=A0A7W5FDJ0_9ACTN|nr:hypothetical protein [Actinoplanes campanulatus]
MSTPVSTGRPVTVSRVPFRVSVTAPAGGGDGLCEGVGGEPAETAGSGDRFGGGDDDCEAVGRAGDALVAGVAVAVLAAEASGALLLARNSWPCGCRSCRTVRVVATATPVTAPMPSTTSGNNATRTFSGQRRRSVGGGVGGGGGHPRGRGICVASCGTVPLSNAQLFDSLLPGTGSSSAGSRTGYPVAAMAHERLKALNPANRALWPAAWGRGPRPDPVIARPAAWGFQVLRPR